MSIQPLVRVGLWEKAICYSCLQKLGAHFELALNLLSFYYNTFFCPFFTKALALGTKTHSVSYKRAGLVCFWISSLFKINSLFLLHLCYCQKTLSHLFHLLCSGRKKGDTTSCNLKFHNPSRHRRTTHNKQQVKANPDVLVHFEMFWNVSSMWRFHKLSGANWWIL